MTKPHQTVPTLTPREMQVLIALSQGQSARDMASSFDKAYNSIRYLLHNIHQKLNSHSVVSCLVTAFSLKLIPLPDMKSFANTHDGQPLVLSLRETHLLEFLIEGKDISQIADILEVPERVVRAKYSNLYCHLEVDSRQKAVLKALALGLVTLPSS